MRPLRTRLEEARQRTGLPWEVLERDYILSWVLAGIYQAEALREHLIFKGGTALKKCYFGDYRFSEDLDFSALEDAPVGDALEKAMQGACETAMIFLDKYAPVEIVCDRYVERQPHPAGQEAFRIRTRLPWHRQLQSRLLVEVTVDEKILRSPQARPVIHDYGEPLEAIARVYALEEIVAEKLRAILQHIDQLRERGWGRSRARDYYDLWRIMGAYRGQLDLTDFPTFLHRKCDTRGVSFQRVDDFFEPTILANVRDTWSQWLGPLVSDLPAFDTVVSDLRPQIAALLSSDG